MVSFSDSGRTINRCSAVDKGGNVLGTWETTAGDGSWLGGIRGACAIGRFLLVPTDDGIVRVDHGSGTLKQTQSFPETYKFVVNLIPNEEQSFKISSANELKPCSIQATATFVWILLRALSQITIAMR
jgi:hypothetical protein